MFEYTTYICTLYLPTVPMRMSMYYIYAFLCRVTLVTKTKFLAKQGADDGPTYRGRDDLDKVPPDLCCYVLWPEELLQYKFSFLSQNMNTFIFRPEKKSTYTVWAK